ncbi:MAG: HAD family hydrolase [Gemmataceae bacterium]|nr:HAD family hydrolase [Gemmataceae bacterium]
MSADEELPATLRRGGYRAVLFDFDGTLSLLRAGWPAVMTEVLCEAWYTAGLSTTDVTQLRRQLLHLVLSTNGMPPLRQMELFAELVRSNGGVPPSPLQCATIYQQRLQQRLRQRYEQIRQGKTPAERWLVPGTQQVLEALHRRGLLLFLLSGTDYEQVQTEAELLGLAPFFAQRLFAPKGQEAVAFSKGQVVDQILQTYRLQGGELLGIGDGVVETREVKRVGGTAIGLASAETVAPDTSSPGAMSVTAKDPSFLSDPLVADKAERLAAAGADWIIPDYHRVMPQLLALVDGTVPTNDSPSQPSCPEAPGTTPSE